MIVGSGYPGLSAAITLSRAGRSVVNFNREDAGWGDSCSLYGPRYQMSRSLMRGRASPGFLLNFYRTLANPSALTAPWGTAATVSR